MTEDRKMPWKHWCASSVIAGGTGDCHLAPDGVISGGGVGVVAVLSFSGLTTDSDFHDCAMKSYVYISQLNLPLCIYKAVPNKPSKAGIVIGGY